MLNHEEIPLLSLDFLENILIYYYMLGSMDLKSKTSL